MASRRRAKRGKAGFALIEVLVAVGIAAVLMAVLIRAFVNTWTGVAVVREEAEGTLLARSLLDEALLRGQLSPGSQDGTLGRYAWTMATSAQTVTAPAGGNNDDNTTPSTSTLFHVVVTLRGPSGRSTRLDAFKIGQPAQ
jgi:prepilin-type N-terminal cleavage/methylation domain-containing protein